MRTKSPTKVQVEAKHIREGIAGDCHRCAVALAMSEATKDPDARVTQRDWQFYVCVWSRWMLAPYEVAHFVLRLDHRERNADGRPRLPKAELPDDAAPFTFELPSFDDPEWQEECCGCEELFAPSELDDEGYCQECREKD